MHTNDPLKPIQVITVAAVIRVAVTLSTTYLYFAGLSDSTVTKTVEIKGMDDEEIQVEPLSFDLENRISYRIEEVRPGREFHVHVTTIPGRAGTYLGELTLKTNHPKKPTVTIRIRGRIKAPAGARKPPSGSG